MEGKCLEHCPFCGSNMQNYTVSFKRDRRHIARAVKK